MNYIIKEMKVEFLCGTDIDEALKTAKQLSRDNWDSLITFDFNDVEVTVMYNDDLRTLKRIWKREMSRGN